MCILLWHIGGPNSARFNMSNYEYDFKLLIHLYNKLNTNSYYLASLMLDDDAFNYGWLLDYWSKLKILGATD